MLTEAEQALFARAGKTNTPEALRSALSEFVNCGSLRRLVEDRLHDSSRIRTIAAASYRHDNGFWKVVLAETDSYKLRAHLWLEGEHLLAAEPNIHNHRWNFSSVLLRGGYVQETFELSDRDDGLPVLRWMYTPAPNGLAGDVIEHGTAHVKPVSQTAFRSGDRIAMSADELHRVVTQAQQTTISLVVNGPTIRSDTSVYTQGRLALLPANVLRRLTPAEVERAIGELGRALAEYEKAFGTRS